MFASLTPEPRKGNRKDLERNFMFIVSYLLQLRLELFGHAFFRRAFLGFIGRHNLVHTSTTLLTFAFISRSAILHLNHRTVNHFPLSFTLNAITHYSSHFLLYIKHLKNFWQEFSFLIELFAKVHFVVTFTVFY